MLNENILIELEVMENWEELKSWYEDLKAWELFQDEKDRIDGSKNDDLQNLDNKVVLFGK